MALSFAPFGLRAVAAWSTHGNGQRAYPLPNGSACPDLNKGAPVKMTAGVITSAGTGAGPILGVANGFAWIDATSGLILRSSIPADTSSAGTFEGENRPIAYVIDNPDTIFMIQADASVTAGDLGLNFNVTASGTDLVNSYGQSRYCLDADSRTSALTGAVKVVGIAKIPDNAWGDAFPVVLVRLNSIVAQVSAA